MTRRAAILTKLFSLPLATGLLCTATQASAQTVPSFNVPFAFTVNHQHVAAGSYTARLESGCFLYLRNVSTGKNQILMVRPEWGNVNESKSSLIFHRDGSQTYLTQVWIAGNHTAVVARPRAERELAKQAVPTDSIKVASK